MSLKYETSSEPQRTTWSVQGYLANKKQPPLGPCSRLSLGAYGGPGGGVVSYERGIPVGARADPVPVLATAGPAQVPKSNALNPKP